MVAVSSGIWPHISCSAILRWMMSTGTLRAPADLDRLRHRFEHAAAFGPHVRGVDAAVSRRHLAHRDQRVGIDPRSRRAAQRAGDAERALLHGLLAPAPASAPVLRRVGGPAFWPCTVGPDLARPDVGADVGRDALLQQAARNSLQIGPIGAFACVLLAASGAADPPSPKIIDVTPWRIMLSALPSCEQWCNRSGCGCR